MLKSIKGLSISLVNKLKEHKTILLLFIHPLGNMIMLICVLGRQPGLAMAELEAVFGPESVERVARDCALIKSEHPSVSQQNLGGVIKVGRVVMTIPSSRMNRIYSASRSEIIRRISEDQNADKHGVCLGLSAYGMRVTPGQMHRLSFDIKRHLKEKGCSAKITVGKDIALNSAQVIHNDLIGKFGYEFLLIGSRQKTYLARTISIQDIESYSKRDYGRPGRDTKTGMLPPKLAQIMLNLAKVTSGKTVLDPFCGTGVVLIEAALQHCKLAGGDVRGQMVDYTKENLKWADKEFSLNTDMHNIIRADATTHKWKGHFDCVVSETYLGRPFSHIPNEKVLQNTVNECNALIRRFLINLRPQLNAKARCCIAVPTWNSPHGLIHLPIIKNLRRLGYKRVSFKNADFSKFVYRRPDQTVARELLVIETR